MNHIDELSKIRKIAAKLATAKDVPPAIGDSARYVLQSMIEEAEDHGFTKAEVIRAIFRPGFRPQKGCDCFTCKARRDAANENQTKGLGRIGIAVEYPDNLPEAA